ncbi:hypothetical protein GCM10010275_19270 [Streptomyces litmocidini]|nr:hypothetical protein GCM10010275_19270 [Streptomyces litmocidini]
MLALIQDLPPGAALFAVIGLLAFLVACRAVVACWLGLTAMRTSDPRDLPKVLAAVRTVVDTAFRLRR